MRVSQWRNPTPKPDDLNTRRNRTFPGHGLYLKGDFDLKADFAGDVHSMQAGT